METNDIVIIGLILATAGFFIFQKLRNTRYKVSADTFKEKMSADKKPQLIDVRSPGEYNAGRIGNALNINNASPDFNERASKLDRKRPVFVYCASGVRSASASRKLAKLGFSQIYDLKGGINAWVQ